MRYSTIDVLGSGRTLGACYWELQTSAPSAVDSFRSTEDNDDLLQIFNQKSYRLRQLYGDFFISELITNPESRKVIVAEEPEVRQPRPTVKP